MASTMIAFKQKLSMLNYHQTFYREEKRENTEEKKERDRGRSNA